MVRTQYPLCSSWVRDSESTCPSYWRGVYCGPQSPVTISLGLTEGEHTTVHVVRTRYPLTQIVGVRAPDCAYARPGKFYAQSTFALGSHGHAHYEVLGRYGRAHQEMLDRYARAQYERLRNQTVVSGLDDVRQIAAGYRCKLMLTGDGRGWTEERDDFVSPPSEPADSQYHMCPNPRREGAVHQLLGTEAARASSTSPLATNALQP